MTVTAENEVGTGESRNLAVLVGAAIWSVVAGALAVLVAFLIDGGDAAVGALIGAGATVGILAFGTWIVLKVADVAPVASLLAALGVFTAQGVLLVVTLAVLAKVTDGPQVTAAALAVVAVTVVWTTMFAVLVRREQIPLFDMSALDGPGAE